MTAIDTDVAETLTALTTALVFSAGFLSTRVHGERERAIDRTTQLGDQIRSAITGKELLDPELFDSQVEALDRSLPDRLDRLVAGLNVALGLGVIVLAIGTGLTAEISWRSSPGVLLIAFAVAAFAVTTIGTLDVWLARRDIEQYYTGTAVGQMTRADTMLRRAAAQDHPAGKQLERLSEAAESAVRSSYGRYGPAWATLAYARLLTVARPGPASLPPEHLLFAERTLERAVLTGPETAAARAALAWVYEYRKDNERAAANLVRALWLEYEARRPLAYSDDAVAATRARARIRGDPGPYGWRFMPEQAVTLSLALGKLPPLLSPAMFTAQLLATRSASSPPDDQHIIVQSLRRWLQQCAETGGWWLAAARAQWLRTLNASGHVTATVDDFINEARRQQTEQPIVTDDGDRPDPRAPAAEPDFLMATTESEGEAWPEPELSL